MKTRQLLESTIPVMYHNGMTDLTDFLKVMDSMHVEGEDLQFATQIFMSCAAGQTQEEAKVEEPEEAERLSDEEMQAACVKLKDFLAEQDMGLNDVLGVTAATLSGVMLDMCCDDNDEAAEVVKRITDEAIEMLMRHLEKADNFPSLMALRLIALRILFITSDKDIIMPIVEHALRQRGPKMMNDFLSSIFSQEDCDHDCEECCGCDDEEDEADEVAFEAGIKVRMAHKVTEMEDGVPCKGMIAIKAGDLPKGFESILEKASKKGMESLSEKERHILSSIIEKAIKHN